MTRPMPYQGNQRYIFVSYAHKDSDLVWPIIRRMQQDGCRVWYDEGIDPGSEWDQNIASHVEGCGYFIAFLSQNYLDSENCKDELNYARDLGKDRLLVYLEDVTLPGGMAMRLNRLQAVFWNRYENKDEFYAKLYAAQGLAAQRDVPISAVEAAPEPEPEPTPQANSAFQSEDSKAPRSLAGKMTSFFISALAQNLCPACNVKLGVSGKCPKCGKKWS